ncbi:hypothetical protein DKP76_13440 [Falsochrobactrum shanghaiense]|uniref:Bacteriophage SP-beta YorD domain-containing protein n=1 Tax=Falsochrobactrum shanghaiense TaxID=2201899 RepID=A0A316J7C6_9HYPH|nr:hypothetical protein [Falsochrobactrum shanghaiense]PWL17038.1 hypothetical protein DKP76_13440 [Falsochrobactrum shanghaiense]
MTFISHEQTIHAIKSEWPELLHGRDFWVGQPVRENSNEYLGDAFIAAWSAEDAEQPSEVELAGLVAKYNSDWNASSRERMPHLTARQLRLGLLSLGKLDAVPTAIAALPEPEKSQAEIEWQFASEFHRLHPLVVQLIPILALTDEQVDTVWLEYSQV